MVSENKSISIIFDLDGTLVDTQKIIIPSFQKICPKFKLETPTNEIIIAAVGYGFPEFYYKIFGDMDTELMNTLNAEIEKAEGEMVAKLNKDILFKDIVDTLSILKDMGVEMHIASTGYTAHVYDCLKYCDIGRFFKKIRCNMPNKELMVEGIIKSNPAKNWLMVGDRRKDSTAAKYNSIVSIGAGYGYCNEADFNQFDYIAKKTNEIIDLVYKISK